MPHLGDGMWILLSLILFDAGRKAGDTGGVIRVSPGGKARFQGFKVSENSVARPDALQVRVKAKKCGAEIGDPNLRFQPRLPGSVVGEASMRQVRKAGKITRVTVPW